jgi:hypothetical protein
MADRAGQLPHASETGPDALAVGGRTRWIVALLLAGVSAGLFSIVIYQVFNFFGVSWLLFANLLFMGYPLGGWLYLRFFDGRPGAFAHGLHVLLACMVGSIGLLFVVKYPTLWWASSLWSPNAVVGLVKLSVFTALPFLPFFVAWGLVEVAGYRAWQRSFGAGADLVYGLYLFGLALGYLLFSLGIESLGLLRLALLALVAWGAARLAVAGPRSRLVPVVAALPLAVALLPGLDAFFFRHLHPEVLFWRGGRIEVGNGFDVLHEGWDRSGHLTILGSDRLLLGAYVPAVAWGFERNAPPYRAREFGRAAFRFLPPDADVLIIGSGGGRDVAHALEHRPRRVVAVEIRGRVVDVLRGKLSARVDGVYDHPAVEPVVMNGRRFVESTDRLFDLILLPAVDGLMINTRTLFDASEYMHTVEAFRAMRARLDPGGVIAVIRARGYDPELRQFSRIFRHMESVGLTPLGLLSGDAYALLGLDLRSGAALPGPELFRDLPVSSLVTRIDDPPPLVHDDRPYPVGIPGALIPPVRMAVLFAIQVVLFGALAAVVALLLSRPSARARWPVERGGLVMGAGILVGANFLALQYQIVFVLLHRLEQPFDAVFVAAILFPLVCGLGSLGVARLGEPIAVAAAVAGLLVALLLQATGPGLWQVLALLPATFLTGRFFPRVFGSSEGRMLRVFAMDAVGAFLATILAAFVPILFGFTAYLLIVALLFLGTFFVVSRAAEAEAAA